MDISWNGRDITIERRTKGRTPFGVFKAYETETGLEVEELTAANCGQMLLGVEKSVFTRTGFLRLNDLPVTQDEALRRRLNALVTTGDESGAGEALGAKLKELKNACRYNRSGLLPKAEAELAALEDKQRELVRLNRDAQMIGIYQEQTETYLRQLKNHQAAIAYQNALADQARVRVAERAVTDAVARRDRLEGECAALPGKEAAEEKRRQVRDLQQQWMAVQEERQALPQEPEEPEKVAAFEGMEPAELLEKVQADAARYAVLCEKMEKKPVLGWICMILGLLAMAVSAALQLWVVLGLGALLLAFGMVAYSGNRKLYRDMKAEAEALADNYPWREPDRWMTEAESYLNRQNQYRSRLAHHKAALEALEQRTLMVRQQLQELTQGLELRQVLETLQQVIDHWSELEDARGDLKQAENYLQSIRAMAKTAVPPEFEDSLTLSELETNQKIGEYTLRKSQLIEQLGKLHGAMNAMGDEQVLQTRIDGLRKRIADLEETAAALDMAQQTLAAATEQLQRRFAPRIAERAKDLFAKLTGGRYDRLNLTRELTVDAAAAGEMTMRSAQWRSEGTVDQLYIALRLAVAEELVPDAPLVLDDALVRFDDQRLKNALSLLVEATASKQVILFTCQNRESEIYDELK